MSFKLQMLYAAVVLRRVVSSQASRQHDHEMDYNGFE